MDPVVRSITVVGEGKVTVKPDVASLNLGVQALESTATDALARANESARDLVAALKTAGVAAADIVTSGVSVYAQQGGPRNKVTGYQASNSVTVTIHDVDRTGAVIDAASIAAGERLTIGGVSFHVDDTEAVIGGARKNAIDNAKKRATEYAQAAGVAVGEVLKISEGSVDDATPMGFRAAARTFAAMPIEPGMDNVTVSVTVVYAIA